MTLYGIVLGVFLCLVLLAALPARAQEQPATVRSDPAVIELTPGQTVTVSVVLVDAREVYGIDVRAAFDPDLVEVVDADPEREGVQFTPGSFPQPDFLVRNVADNQVGTLRYVITQVNPTEPASGAGVIFTVQFRARADSGEGPFTIGLTEMADRNGVLLPMQTESGLIKIVSAEPAALDEGTQPPPAAEPAQVAPAAPAQVEPPTSAGSGTIWPLLAIAALIAGVIAVAFIVVRRRGAG